MFVFKLNHNKNNPRFINWDTFTIFSKFMNHNKKHAVSKQRHLYKQIKISKGQQISKQNCQAVTSPKNQWRNLFFYPDCPEIHETLKSKFKFQVFLSRQNRKTNLSVHVLGEVTAWQFCFEIYWPLDRDKLMEVWVVQKI